jgi:hypothetical protein
MVANKIGTYVLYIEFCSIYRIIILKILQICQEKNLGMSRIYCIDGGLNWYFEIVGDFEDFEVVETALVSFKPSLIRFDL